MADFSRVLRMLRTNTGLSQQALADKLGLSKSAVNMYERGEREPSFEVLESASFPLENTLQLLSAYYTVLCDCQ